ncbi:unnamed protein product, partial [Laminaria digitata]
VGVGGGGDAEGNPVRAYEIGVDNPRPPPMSSGAAFGEPPCGNTFAGIGDIGVTACPSPFVNTSSPLTRGGGGGGGAGGEASLFGLDPAEERSGNGAVGGAADLFATLAPARAANELFESDVLGAQLGAVAASDGGSSLGGGGGGGDQGGGYDTSVFSQAPPPETPVVPPPSLPNPWGSSPQKQPLPEPKRWPTKGGTGFDRPLTPLSAGKVPVRGNARSSGDTGGGSSAAFFGSAAGDVSGAEDGDLVGAEGGGVPLDGGVFQTTAASFTPPTATSAGVGVAAARPWEGGGSNRPSFAATGGDGHPVPAAFGEASRAPVPPASAFSSTRFGDAGGLKG